MATRNQEILNRKKSLVESRHARAGIERRLQRRLPAAGTESLIKAVESRLDPQARGIGRAQGSIILAPYFGEVPAVYEKQESTMQLYYKEMIQAIDVVRKISAHWRKFAKTAPRGLPPLPVSAPVTGR